jgi:hypothetical protein
VKLKFSASIFTNIFDNVLRVLFMNNLPHTSECLPLVRQINFSSALKSDWQKESKEHLVLIIDENQITNKKLSDLNLQNLDVHLSSAVSEWLQVSNFEGKWLQCQSIPCPNKLVAKTITLLGSGSQKTESAARARQIGIKIGEEIASGKFSSLKITGCSDFYVHRVFVQSNWHWCFVRAL